MKKVALFIIVFIQGNIICLAQDLSLYQKKWMVQNGDTLPYRILLPKDYDSTKFYPLIFFLHGAGERGRDNEKQLTHGAKLFLKEEVRENYKAIVIIPQCPINNYWGNMLRIHGENEIRSFYFLEDGPPGRYMVLLQQLVTFVIDKYPVQKKQVYVGGLSMGGMGTFELVRRMPKIFSAAFPICGGANSATAKKMKKVSWWIFHGAKDDVVSPLHSKVMYEALQKQKADVKYTLYPNANHNSWDNAFAEPELMSWLFSKHK